MSVGRCRRRSDLGPSRLDRIDPGTVRDASGGVLPGVTVTATLQVEASAGLIETRHRHPRAQRARVELPLDGRHTLDLVYMTGMAAPSGTLSGARGGAAGAGSYQV